MKVKKEIFKIENRAIEIANSLLMPKRLKYKFVGMILDLVIYGIKNVDEKNLKDLEWVEKIWREKGMEGW